MEYQQADQYTNYGSLRRRCEREIITENTPKLGKGMDIQDNEQYSSSYKINAKRNSERQIIINLSNMKTKMKAEKVICHIQAR
mgnify:CR=1 FL=1